MRTFVTVGRTANQERSLQRVSLLVLVLAVARAKDARLASQESEYERFKLKFEVRGPYRDHNGINLKYLVDIWY